jgi:putative transposase
MLRNTFGPMFAGDLRRQRVSRMPAFRHWRWHMDGMNTSVNGEVVYLWRVADHEGKTVERDITKTATRAQSSFS